MDQRCKKHRTLKKTKTCFGNIDDNRFNFNALCRMHHWWIITACWFEVPPHVRAGIRIHGRLETMWNAVRVCKSVWNDGNQIAIHITNARFLANLAIQEDYDSNFRAIVFTKAQKTSKFFTIEYLNVSLMKSKASYRFLHQRGYTNSSIGGQQIWGYQNSSSQFLF